MYVYIITHYHAFWIHSLSQINSNFDGIWLEKVKTSSFVLDWESVIAILYLTSHHVTSHTHTRTAISTHPAWVSFQIFSAPHWRGKKIKKKSKEKKNIFSLLYEAELMTMHALWRARTDGKVMMYFYDEFRLLWPLGRIDGHVEDARSCGSLL